MKQTVIDLLNQGMSGKAIARKLNTTEWQIRQVRRQLNEEKVNNPSPLYTENVKLFKKLEGKKFPRTMIFTSWEIRNQVDDEFLDILSQIKKHYSAELFLVPVWPDDVKYLPEKLKNFTLVTSDIEINDNLFFKYVPTHALVVSPLSGWKGTFPEKSVIIPGLVRDMITEPSVHLAKQIMSTGSIGRLNPSLSDYNHLDSLEGAEKSAFQKRWASVTNRRNGKIYAIAQEYTVPSALIVQVIDNKTFLTRYISMPKNGVVYDMNLQFTAGHSKPKISHPAALVMGDYHAWQGDEVAWKATLEMLDYFNPDSIVLNDFFDGLSCSHYEVEDAAAFFKAPTIEEEAEFTKNKLKEICSKAKKVYYNHSNHDDFLPKYLKIEQNYKYNFNYAICLELRAWQIRTERHPIIKLLELDSIKNLEFIDDDANHKIAGVTNIHGHQGISGRRVGFRALAQIYNKLMMSHSHSPGFFRNSANTGTTSKLKMHYNKGLSAWLHCNGLIHSDSSTQLVTIINGVWRAE